MTSEQDVSVYVRAFEAAEDATRDARLLAERDRDYYDEKQLTAEEIAALNARGQPTNISNFIKRKVNAMMGMEKQTRKDPKAFPRNPDDEDASRAATDAIRYVCDDSRWDDKRSSAAKELAIEGTAAVMVGSKKVKGGFDPDIRRITWDRFYFDPHSSEFDFADAQFMGVVAWMELDDAVRKFPEAKDVLEATWMSARDTETYDDKPKWNLWADYKRKRVRVCEHYYREGGVWKFCIFTKAGFVSDPVDSPYLDSDGEPECPIKAVSLYVDRDNNRYGEVRTMIGPQDALNKAESKFLHLITQRQVRVSPVVASDPKTVRKELARPDGVFVGEAGDVEILPTNDMAAANFQFAMEQKNVLNALGPNAALAGKNEQQQSGKAILAQQQGGMVELTTYLDTIRVLSLAVYRSVWARIRQYWNEERWVRVTDNDMNVRFVGLNRPQTALQMMAKQMGVTKENMEQQPPEVIQQLQMAAQDPRSQMVVSVENNVTELDVDIVIDEGIDTPTVQAEQFDTLVKMIPALGPLGQSPQVLKFLVEASSLRGKEKLLEIFEPQGQQGPSPEEQMAQQMEAQMALEQQRAQMEGEVELQKAQIKAQSDIEVAKIKAEADAEAKRAQMRVDVALESEKRLMEADTQAQVDEKTGVKASRDAEMNSQQMTAEAMARQTMAMEQLAQIMLEMNRPRTKVPVRDENGLIIGVREVYEDAA
ncbi:MAG: hypothetical protein RL268_1479 [Pseudomonadota bacterium]|jgi:hypothetical protein